MAETSSETPAKKVVDPLVGQTLAGRFTMLELIDRGGMGKIFRAEQQPLGRIVAVKTLDIIDHTGEFKKRFFLEAASCAKLSHPNTVRVFDYGASDDQSVYFLVMEFLVGRPLHVAIHHEAPFKPLRAIQIARQVCGALQEAHDAAIVHRDLKPQNIFLVHQGDDPDYVKVVDFGLVKEMGVDAEVSKSGNVLGSPMYMAPEQVEGRPVDARSDVYALGLILYVMLSGHTPYKRGDSLTIMMQQLHKDPLPFAEEVPNVQVPENLEWIVRTAFEKDPAERFASMRELGYALKIVEKQLRGDLDPVPLRLIDGKVDRAVSSELTDEVPRGPVATSRPSPKLDDTSQSQSLVQSMVRPAPIALGVLSLGAASSIVAGVILAIAAVAGLLWTHGGAETPAVKPPPAVAALPPKADPLPAAAPIPVPEPVTVLVKLGSDPTGAEVAEGGVVIGTTPLDVRVPDGSSRTLDLALPGRERKTVRITGDQATLTVTLAKLASKAQEAPKAQPAVTPAPVVTPPVEPYHPPKMDEIKNPFGH